MVFLNAMGRFTNIGKACFLRVISVLYQENNFRWVCTKYFISDQIVVIVDDCHYLVGKPILFDVTWQKVSARLSHHITE
jgi:hypothetical protein